MNNDTLRNLLLIIEKQLSWGNSAGWTTRDFENLNILIQEKTKISLSASTLRRVWGKVDYNNQPSMTTLDTLAKFADFDSWRNFNAVENKNGNSPGLISKKLITSINPQILRIMVVAAVITAICIISVLLIRSVSSAASVNYTFNYRSVTHNLPNSVVFTYDAHNAPEDSVFIQQSWDDSRKIRVAKTGHEFSSIYYRPGFYHAKLSVGNRVVKEKPLLIPTTGWLGMLEQEPVPVYLERAEYLTKNGLGITTAMVTAHKVNMEPQPPVVSFYNVGNFSPVPAANFSYSAEVKNDYKTGAAKCQQLQVILITNNIPISIAVAQPGCIASLSLLTGEGKVSASTADFSGFGTDVSSWVKISCVSSNNQVIISINNKPAYRFHITDKHMNILGLGYTFTGTGQVRHIKLSSGNTMVFHDFD